MVLSITYADYGFNQNAMLLVLPAIGLGLLLAQKSSNDFFLLTLKKLEGSSHQGVFSLLGPPPFHIMGLSRVDSQDQVLEIIGRQAPAEFNSIKLHSDFLLGHFIEDYRKRFATSHPAHVALFDAVLATYCHSEQLRFPAGFRDIHGGRSLLTHCLLVSALCYKESLTWSHVYKPSGKVRPQDVKYIFDVNDPLVPIMGLAHDIGKLECFEWEDGKVVGIAGNHDLIGARIISRFGEYWDPRIDATDRLMLQNILSFYHHQGEIPVEKVLDAEGKAKPQVTSDRQHALLELLIRCDTIAGSLESGRNYQESEASAEDVFEQANEGNLEDLLTKLIDYFVTHARINTSGATKSAAIKYSFTDLEKDLLIVDEAVFLEGFTQYAKVAQMPAEKVDQRTTNPITKLVLETLDAEGVLYRSPTDTHAERSAATSLYRMEFKNPSKNEDVSFTIKRCFLIDITDWDALSILKDRANFACIPKFGNPCFGAAGGVRTSVEEDIAKESITGSEPVPVGDSVEKFVDMVSTFISSKNPNKPPNPKKIKADLHEAILKNQIVTQEDFELNALVVVGQDAEFEKIGINLDQIAKAHDLLRKLGIKGIQPSTKIKGQHAVFLEKNEFK